MFHSQIIHNEVSHSWRNNKHFYSTSQPTNENSQVAHKSKTHSKLIQSTLASKLFIFMSFRWQRRVKGIQARQSLSTSRLYSQQSKRIRFPRPILSWASACFLPVTCWLLLPYPWEPGFPPAQAGSARRLQVRGMNSSAPHSPIVGFVVNVLCPGASPASRYPPLHQPSVSWLSKGA